MSQAEFAVVLDFSIVERKKREKHVGDSGKVRTIFRPWLDIVGPRVGCCFVSKLVGLGFKRNSSSCFELSLVSEGKDDTRGKTFLQTSN